MVHRVYDVDSTDSGRNSPKPPPPPPYNVSEPPFEGYHAIEQSAYRSSVTDNAIVIDNGPYLRKAHLPGVDMRLTTQY